MLHISASQLSQIIGTLMWVISLTLWSVNYLWLCIEWLPWYIKLDTFVRVEKRCKLNKSIYRSFHIFNCRQLFRTIGPHQYSALNKKFFENLTNHHCLWKLNNTKWENDNTVNGFIQVYMIASEHNIIPT